MVSPTLLDDLRQIELRGEAARIDRELVLDIVGRVPEAEQLLHRYSRTLVHEDEVIAAFGAWPQWTYVASAWALLSPKGLERYPKAIHKAVKANIAEVEAKLELRRLEAVVLFGHAAGHRWIQRLGFKSEGLMRNYGPGGYRHYYRYARTR